MSHIRKILSSDSDGSHKEKGSHAVQPAPSSDSVPAPAPMASAVPSAPHPNTEKGA